MWKFLKGRKDPEPFVKKRKVDDGEGSSAGMGTKFSENGKKMRKMMPWTGSYLTNRRILYPVKFADNMEKIILLHLWW